MGRIMPYIMENKKRSKAPTRLRPLPPMVVFIGTSPCSHMLHVAGHVYKRVQLLRGIANPSN